MEDTTLSNEEHTKSPKVQVHPHSDDAKTLFLSALPEDVNEREIHNLFRFFGGYEGCSIIRPDKKSPMCFVVFSDHKTAVFAKESLSGMRLDPFMSQTLRIDYAHSNSKVKRVPRDFFEGDHDKRLTLVSSDSRSHFTQPIQPIGLPPFAFSPYVNNFPSSGGANKPHDPSDTDSSVPDDSEASPTIFIGNIHKDVHRNDLHRLFSLVPGLKEFRMNYNNKEHPIAFAEFNDAASAIAAMKTLQGAPVGSSRIRLEFSRSQKKAPLPEPANLRDQAPNGFRH